MDSIVKKQQELLSVQVGKANKNKHLNLVIEFILNEYSSRHSFATLNRKYLRNSLSLLTQYVQRFDYEAIAHSPHNNEIRKLVKDAISSSGIINQLHDRKLRDKRLFHVLIDKKNEVETELRLVVRNVNQVSFDPQEIVQTLYRIRKNIFFQSLVYPLFPQSFFGKSDIQALFRPFFELDKISRNEASTFNHYESNKQIYQVYLDNVSGYEGFIYADKIFIPLARNLFQVFKEKCEIKEEKNGSILVRGQNRRYNFNDLSDIEKDLFLEINNDGEGIASSIKLGLTENDFFEGTKEFEVGVLHPGEARSIKLPIKLKKEIQSAVSATFIVSWSNLNGHKTNITSEVVFETQQSDIDWEKLEKNTLIYSKRKIQDESKLFGRNEILNKLIRNAKSEFIESYKLWGQKRVGKSSIALTFQSLLQDQEDIIVAYIEVSRNIDAESSLNELGQDLCREIKSQIRKTDLSSKNELLKVPIGEFRGSLRSLDIYLRDLRDIDDSLRFVLIIDEIDRLNNEFFLPGSFGETFSLAVGKKLNGYEYVGFILVGSENIHLLDYQEINYNSFNDQKIDTFDLVDQYDDYKDIIVSPVEGQLLYSDEAIKLIHEITNGNPYFTNVICSEIFTICCKTRDAEVHTDKVEEAQMYLRKSQSKSAFAHFWDDGLTSESQEKREKLSDIRRRILVAFANSYKASNQYPTANEIKRFFKYPSEYDIAKSEVQSAINNFFSRGIFDNTTSERIRIIPKIFEDWLCLGNGGTLIIEGVADLEAQLQEIEFENSQRIQSEEIEKIVNQYSTQSSKITTKRIKDYLAQFGAHSDQRKIYELLDSFLYIGNEEIAEFLNKSKKHLFPSKEVRLDSSVRTFRRTGVEVFSSTIYRPQNEPYYHTFKTLCAIRANKKLNTLSKDINRIIDKECNTVIILESIALSIEDQVDELRSFFLAISQLKEQPTIRYVSFVMSKLAKFRLDSLVQDIELDDFKVLVNTEVELSDVLPFHENSQIIQSQDRRLRVLTFCRQLDPSTTENSALVLFEKFCPVQSLPLFWSEDQNFNPLFQNSFKLDFSRLNQHVEKVESPKQQSDFEVFEEEIHNIDKKIEYLEIWLRRVIIQVLNTEKQVNKIEDLTGKPFILESINKKIRRHITQYPTEKFEDLIEPEQALEFTDLSNLELIICSKSKKHYQYFEPIFGDIENFRYRFKQILNFRNVKRHLRRRFDKSTESRRLDQIAINDVKAGIEWFERIIESRG